MNDGRGAWDEGRGGRALPDLARARRLALGAGVVGLVLAALGWLLDPTAFFAAYLTAYVLWSGIALGCLGTALLQQVTGGLWGLTLRRIAEAGARTVQQVAVMLLPVLFGLGLLYPWARPADVAASTTIQQKTAYLNEPIFNVRAAYYIACWLVLTRLLDRSSTQEDRTADPAATGRLRRLGVGGLIVLGLTASFAMIDWVMSLEPEWYSTIYPSMVAMGSLLGAFAFMILVVLFLAPRSELGALVTPRLRNDLGSLLLAFLMLWAYQQFSQYLLIWSGNLQEEAPWYVRRQAGIWGWAAVAMMVLGFFVPFFLLIFREIKRSARALGAVAALLLAMRVVEVLWLVGPGLGLGGLYILLSLAAMVGLGGIWLWWFGRELAARPLVPLHDPRLADVAAVARGEREAEHVRA
jgi:hypothetical protein